MTIRKKVAISVTAILIGCVGLVYSYVSVIAKGDQPAWDPEKYKTVSANGMSFSVNLRGSNEDTPVILLHGFPESAVMWDKLLDELAANNFYAIAPNQRGYSSGARPSGIKPYELSKLVSDVIAIADELKIPKFHLIAHDWGAGVGWQLAAEYPERVASYVAISVPHIDSFGRAYREDPDQYESSDYIRFFQKALLPEFVLAQSDYENLKAVWNVHEALEIEHYLRILKQENALTSAINWYRANFPAFEVGLNIGPVAVPTTFIWGNKDHALKRSGVAGTRDLVTSEYQFIEMDAGHWIIQEKYDELRSHLLDHLIKYKLHRSEE